MPSRPLTPEQTITVALHARAHALAMARVTDPAELVEIAAGRTDLLTQEAGLILGTYTIAPAIHWAALDAARLLIAAGADPTGLPPWIDEGRRRAQVPAHGI